MSSIVNYLLFVLVIICTSGLLQEGLLIRLSHDFFLNYFCTCSCSMGMGRRIQRLRWLQQIPRLQPLWWIQWRPWLQRLSWQISLVTRKGTDSCFILTIAASFLFFRWLLIVLNQRLYFTLSTSALSVPLKLSTPFFLYINVVCNSNE